MGVGRAASVKDVAVAAGVSIGTVSNVMNRPTLVRPATRSRVLQAITDLGFVRNESARQLRAGVSHTLGYVMLDATNPFFTDVAHGIDLAAEAANLSLFTCNSQSRAEREQAHLIHLRQHGVQGILITPIDPDAPALHDIVLRGTPLVIVDRVSTQQNFCSVAVDDHLGGHLAMEHLIDMGHRRVAFVGGPHAAGQVADRYAGAHASWLEHGLPPDDLVTFPHSPLTVTGGRSAGERLAGLPASTRPTAAFCANDLVALGVLQHTIGTGRSVPGDLAIVGYDDIEFAAAAAVPLTSVRQPRQELGHTAAELVIAEATESSHSHQQLMFKPDLVARASTL